MNRKLTVLGMAAVMTLAAGFSCGAEALNEEEPFVIGAYMPMTGNNATYAYILERGQDIALEEINSNGGFNGHKVEIIRYDTTSSNEEAAKIAVKLVEDDKVDAALPSPMSNEIKASAPTLNDAHIPTVVVGTSATLLTEADWDYVWRTALNTNYTTGAYADIFEKMDIQTIGIIHSQEDVCVAIADAMQQFCAEQGIEVVDVESVDGTDNDFTAPLANIISANPDIICSYVISPGTAAKQMRQLGYEGIIILRELCGSEDFEVAEDAATDWLFPSLYITYENIEDCDIDYMKSYLERYQENYGELPNYEWTYRGYDSVMALWEASKIAGSNDKEALNEAMGKVVMDGLGGTIDFTSGSHEGYENFGCFIYEDGKFSTFDNWFENGGYEAYKERTGREK